MGIEILFLFGAALAAGAINAIAGGGGLLVFPALLLVGIAPISANATSAMGIWIGMVFSGVAYRHKLSPVANQLLPLTLASLAGATFGAWLLLNFSNENFADIVPYLVGLGTVLFALSPRLVRLARWSHTTIDPSCSLTLSRPILVIGQGIISIYGGFFGGGAGILMLTLLNLTSPGDLPTLQAVKIWMAICINAAAITYFTIENIINWPYALLVAAGTSLGGYSSVYLAQRVPTIWLRRLVIIIGSLLTVYFFTAD